MVLDEGEVCRTETNGLRERLWGHIGSKVDTSLDTHYTRHRIKERDTDNCNTD